MQVLVKYSNVLSKDSPPRRPKPPLGNIGNTSGSGIRQFSPLKYILLGNPQPFLSVNPSAFFCKNMSVVTDPTSYSLPCSSSVLCNTFPQNRAASSAKSIIFINLSYHPPFIILNKGITIYKLLSCYPNTTVPL